MRWEARLGRDVWPPRRSVSVCVSHPLLEGVAELLQLLTSDTPAE